MTQDLAPGQLYRFDPALLAVDPDHNWGISLCHYGRDYCEALLGKLRAEH
ncbi:MAG: hypothetical protein LBR19_05840 [Bifidobacteriaceae bacterium]|jgi:hypothetical protein|nr:hypothetical protein [Bifidobacteriaceae bacterium]